MSRQTNVMGLAPARHFASLAQSTDDAQVDASVVDQVVLDKFLESPLARELLARRQRDAGRGAQSVEALGVLGADRVLQEEEAIRLQRVGQLDRERGVEAGVDVQAQLDLVAHHLADLLHPPHPIAYRVARLDHVLARGEAPAHELPASRSRLARALQQLVQGVGTVVRIANHPLTDSPTQQLVDRHTQRPALDVPECDVDRRDGRGDDVAAGEEAAPIHQLPEVLDTRRVLTDDLGLEVLERPENRMGPISDPSLADAADAIVRVDYAEDIVAAVDLDGERLESGDLHGWEFNLTPQPPSLKGRGSLSINSAFPSREGGWGVRSGPAARRKRPSRRLPILLSPVAVLSRSVILCRIVILSPYCHPEFSCPFGAP